ncbi:hypothetical protein BamIOP4010DRAFT_6871 [Burkholderia ambifaria IOP40-10]|uniref:Uncharacterized protein n=1 Tax=Burkholderia ambifaria IOP40-10 TaxID=396596 RepID=B1FS58_9BURK|nr:hypothetical protein BamIOP4010DRAFT_6871 [Burkholderia ambifaria IOP40-10]
MTINVRYSPRCRNVPIRIVPANPATPITSSSTDNPAAPACVTASRNGRKYVNSVNCPMKKTLTAVMPSATGALASSANARPGAALPCAACMRGRLASFQPNAIAATGTTQKNAHRQPTMPPRKLPSGAATTVASALPPLTIASARGTCRSGTRRIAVAADIDQNPPMATPISARPAMNAR